MLIYNNKAKYIKNIDNETYRQRASLISSMLKYKNDSSAILRLQSAFIDENANRNFDISFFNRFNFLTFSWNNLSTFNRFLLLNLNIIESDYYTNTYTAKGDIIGYSKYTAKTYSLKQYENSEDFINHSFPIDCFFTEKTQIPELSTHTLIPYVPVKINKRINCSHLTFEIPSSLHLKNLDNFYTDITIEVTGIDARNESISETVGFKINTSIITANEYIYIKEIRLIGCLKQIEVYMYPYIKADSILWENVFIDRKELDLYYATISVDKENKRLVLSKVQREITTFPWYNDPVEHINLSGLNQSEAILCSYLEEEKRLLYILTSENRLFVYPIIKPKKYTDTLDDLKTGRQLLNIEYYLDTVDEVCDIDIFPNSNVEDLSLCDIYVNDNLYLKNISLDMIKHSMATNKIKIPFSVLFNSSDTAIVKFVSGETMTPIFVDNVALTPLYVKDLLEGAGEQTSSTLLSPTETLSEKDYKSLNEAVVLPENSIIFKLKKSDPVIISGYRIQHIYDGFYYDTTTSSIITHNTITGIIN